MSQTGIIGELQERDCRVNIEWKIPDFLSLPEDTDSVYYSPVFFFSNSRWCLAICPYGYSKEESTEYVQLYICHKDLDRPKSVSFTFYLKGKDGNLVNKLTADKELFTKTVKGKGYTNFLKRSELLDENSKIITLGALTVICKLYCHEPHSKKDSRIARLFSVIKNLKDILKNEKQTDVILKLTGCEIPSHRLILGSRSTVFAGMFAHDMEENRTGVVKIDDVEEDVLRCVLSYIYSGEVEEMCSENVCSIYVAADKYDLQELKELCMGFMQENLSIDLICDALSIAHIYDDTELIDISKRYFAENLKEIIKTDKWKAFKSENSALAWAIIENAVEGV